MAVVHTSNDLFGAADALKGQLGKIQFYTRQVKSHFLWIPMIWVLKIRYRMGIKRLLSQMQRMHLN